MTNGSCLCGGVTFSIGPDTSKMNHCHCSMCRKIHGSAFATYLNAKELNWLGGEHLIQEFESSPGFLRSFCKQCGSVLPQRSGLKPVYFVPAGLLDSDPGIRPDSHIFVESRAPWYEVSDQLPQMECYGADDDTPVIKQPERGETAGSGFCGGSCQCGKVVYRYSGRPDYLMYCHCSRCRKVKGAAHATNLFVAPEQFEWVQGEADVVVYDLPGAQRFGNSFCRDCGSSVPRKSANSPLWNIPAGSLDNDPEIAPKAHIFTGSKAPWFEISDTMTQHDEMPG